MLQGECGIIPTVSCRKTGNRSIRGCTAQDSCTKVSRPRSRRGETRVIRSRHMLGGVSCVIPLGIPVASTGHARGAVFLFPSAACKSNVERDQRESQS